MRGFVHGFNYSGLREYFNIMTGHIKNQRIISFDGSRWDSTMRHTLVKTCVDGLIKAVINIKHPRYHVTQI